MNFPYKNCNPYKDKLDVYLLKELKETFCHLNQVRFVLLVLTGQRIRATGVSLIGKQSCSNCDKKIQQKNVSLCAYASTRLECHEP